MVDHAHRGRLGRAWRTGVAVLRAGGALWVLLAAGLALASPGALDPGFGNAGVRVFPPEPGVVDWDGASVVVQSDGKLVVATPFSQENTNDILLVWRFLPSGDLDPNFGTSGAAALNVPGETAASAVALQRDGKIVVAGTVYYPETDDEQAIVTRFKTDGTLDGSFNGTGFNLFRFLTGESAAASGVAIQQDGKIVVAGSAGPFGGRGFALARLTGEGVLDSTFGLGGSVVTGFGGTAVATAVALQKDGKIVAAGDTVVGPSDVDFALARYLPNGSLDASFGSDHTGKVITDFGARDFAYALAIQKDGKMVVAGVRDAGGNQRGFALARYKKDGRLDRSFDHDGKVTTDFGMPSVADAVVIQKDGKIVAAGVAYQNNGDFALARYNQDGRLDRHFGTNGLVTTNLGGSDDQVLSVALQRDGKIVATGSSGSGGQFTLALARYLTH